MEADHNTEEEVYVKDREGLFHKLKQFFKDGIDALQLIADFDQTLTRAKVDGKNASSTFCVLHESEYVSERYLKEGKENYEHYVHIEHDADMPLEEKEKHMNDWWEADLNGIIKEKLSKDNFLSMTRKSNLYFRNGISELFQLKQKHKFPFLVVSAGIGEVIRSAFEIYFESSGISVDSLKPFSIISNLGIYDENGTLVGFQSPYITIMNKDVNVSRFVEEQKHKDEEEGHHVHGNLIMMGDITEDVKMLNKIDIGWSIKVGFLNNAERQSDPEYFDSFCSIYDIVIWKDGNMSVVNRIIKALAGEDEECQPTVDVIEDVLREARA